MSKKLVWLGVGLVIFFIIFTSSVFAWEWDIYGIECSDGNFIYADNYTYGAVPNCVVAKTQTVTVSQTGKYYFTDLTINPGITLKFRGEHTGEAKYLSDTGGDYGLPNGGCQDRYAGTSDRRGGSGGDGGAISSLGKTGEHRFDAYGGYSTQDYVGPKVTLVVLNNAVINGIIDVSGFKGGNGEIATGETLCGYPGGGGGGGTGGGILTVIARSISGDPAFIANGGDGGDAGNPSDDEGRRKECGYWTSKSEDCAGGSGGGGGGEAGKIILASSDISFSLTDESVAQCNGGKGGDNSCSCDSGTPSQARQEPYVGKDAPNRALASCIVQDTSMANTEASPLLSVLENPESPTTVYPQSCNNALDDDGGNGMDMADVSCQEACPSFIMDSVNINVNSWYSYTTGVDGCCGDDIGDYGFISSVSNRRPGNFTYMCYGEDINSLQWYNAVKSGNAYNIFNIYTPKGIVDTVSNSWEWFKCNATNDVTISGKSIPEGGTFGERFSDGQHSCADLFSILSDNTEIFNDTCYKEEGGVWREVLGGNYDPPYVENCCEKVSDNGVNYFVQTENDILNCRRCFLAGKNGAINPEPYSPSSSSNIGNIENFIVNKDLCVADPEWCLNYSYDYRADKNCAGQLTPFRNTLCDSSLNFCSQGLFLETNEGPSSPASMKCCFGPEAKCVAKSNIQDISSCTYYNGTAYRGDFTFCFGESQPIGVSDRCCFGVIYNGYVPGSYSFVSNESFICHKENNTNKSIISMTTKNNVISQCCYDSLCANDAYSTSNEISDFDRRVLTRGSAIHTVENFDTFDDKTAKNSPINDWAQGYVINSVLSGSASPAKIYLTSDLSLQSFTYIEFDVLTDSSTIGISINNKEDLGELSKYYTNGDSPRVWHHVVIPIQEKLPDDIVTLNSILFYDDISNGVNKKIIIDNIILTAEGEHLTQNTKNYYCTGGFESWISDLDASPTAGNFEEYGQNMLACMGIGSFGWTGTQCCGDDTKIINYGEFFNDTQGGCFNGSKIINNQRISDVKGIKDLFPENNDELKDFINKDILFFNNTFIGCQVPEDKYSGLDKSFDGQTTGDSLIAYSISQQCGIIQGVSYYCIDGTWRKRISINSTNINESEFRSGMNISLKTVPSGPNLLKTSFGGIQ